MADISIQFHALPEETIPVVGAFIDDLRPHVLCIGFPPFEVWQIDRSQIAEAMQDENVRRIALVLGKPIPTAGTMSQLLERNPDALILDIGRKGGEGLKESWLTASTSNAEALKAWRKLAKIIRSMTKTGAIAVNPSTGATAKLKDHRFSDGAMRLDAKGVPMLPAAGTSRLRFTESSGRENGE